MYIACMSILNNHSMKKIDINFIIKVVIFTCFYFDRKCGGRFEVLYKRIPVTLKNEVDEEVVKSFACNIRFSPFFATFDIY